MVVHLLYNILFLSYVGEALVSESCAPSLTEPCCYFQMLSWFWGRHENVCKERELQRKPKSFHRWSGPLSCCLKGWGGVCQMHKVTGKHVQRDRGIKQIFKNNFIIYWALVLCYSCWVFRYNISKSGNGHKMTYSFSRIPKETPI